MALDWISQIYNPLAVEEVTIEVDGQTVIPLEKSYLVGMDMIDVYKNGTLVPKSAYTEASPTSIIYNDDSLRAGDLITIRHHAPNDINIGDLRVVATYGDLLNLADIQHNTVAIVTELKKFYLYDGSGWIEWNIPFTTKNIGIFFKYEQQPIIDTTQTTYTMEEITYNPGTNNLLVFINGLLVRDYTEVDDHTITFDYEELPEGIIEFLVADTDPWEDTHNHNIEYVYDSHQNIKQEVVTYNNQTVRTTDFEYDDGGNIIKETIVKNLKKIEKVYTYNANGDITNVEVTVSSL